MNLALSSYICQGIDYGHIRAILQANRLRKIALNLYRQEQLSDPIPEEDVSLNISTNTMEIMNEWFGSDIIPRNSYNKLFEFPKSIIIENNPDVLRWFFPNRKIFELSKYDLIAMVIYLETHDYAGILNDLLNYHQSTRTSTYSA